MNNPLNDEHLSYVAHLACLNPVDPALLLSDIQTMMTFAEGLRLIQTEGVIPLIYPLSAVQTERLDEPSFEDLLPQLKNASPRVDDAGYWVPLS
jgi:Asp-tRNA(Asn)/Glu-tRNA(Gln) amidotransferase C subunit